MAIDISAVARVTGITTSFQDFRAGRVVYLPQRIAVFAQGNDAEVYPVEKTQISSAAEAGQIFGFGSPAHLIARQLLPEGGQGVGTIPVTIYPLEAPQGGTAAAGAIVPASAPTGSGSVRLRIGGVLSAPVTLNNGQTLAAVCQALADAINGQPAMPVIATATSTQVDLAAKWSGAIGDSIQINVSEQGAAAVDFGVTAMANGSGVLSVTSAIAQVGEVWETFAINTASYTDSAILDEIEAFGEGRWGGLTRKPIVFVTATTEVSLSTVAAETVGRTADRVNSVIAAPGSPELPFVIAASAVARLASVAQNNPPQDYGRQPLLGLQPGAAGVQWDYLQRDQAVKAGVSTTQVRDGRIELADVVTPFSPAGIEDPGYRYVVDIVKLGNVIFNFDLTFAVAEWDGAPLVPNDQPTVNPTAKRPRDAAAAIYAIVDSLADEAIISDPAFTKANTAAQISAQNPKRLDVNTAIKLSGNTNIVAVGLFFGFYFG